MIVSCPRTTSTQFSDLVKVEVPCRQWDQVSMCGRGKEESRSVNIPRQQAREGLSYRHCIVCLEFHHIKEADPC